MKLEKMGLKRIEIIGFFIVSILAVVFHFLYEWCGENLFVGFFSAVNESVWEHTKIIVFPFLLYAIFEIFYTKINVKKFIIAKTISLWLMVFMMISFFYTYSGIIGTNITAIDISSTFFYIAIAFYVSFKISTANFAADKYYVLALIFLALLIISMIVFTIFPPHIPLFMDSTNQSYGVKI